MPLEVKKLHPDAILPTIGHPTEDLGYDLYAVEDTIVYPGIAAPVSTGISASFFIINSETKFGLSIRDRSSIALQNLHVMAGVVDAGYTGEIKVVFTNLTNREYLIRKGQKIAQMIPTEVLTDNDIRVVEDHPETSRKDGGFGSTDASKNT